MDNNQPTQVTPPVTPPQAPIEQVIPQPSQQTPQSGGRGMLFLVIFLLIGSALFLGAIFVLPITKTAQTQPTSLQTSSLPSSTPQPTETLEAAIDAITISDVDAEFKEIDTQLAGL